MTVCLHVLSRQLAQHVVHISWHVNHYFIALPWHSGLPECNVRFQYTQLVVLLAPDWRLVNQLELFDPFCTVACLELLTHCDLNTASNTYITCRHVGCLTR